MKLLFLTSTKKRELNLGEAFAAGVRRHDDEVVVTARRADPYNFSKFDVVAMVGVKSTKLWRAVVKAGAIPMMFDKGYVRTRAPRGGVWEYWRVSIGAHQPTRIMMADNMPSDRFDSLKLPVHSWRDEGDHILIAGSSAKYHYFHGLQDPTTWARKVAKRIAKNTRLPIIYRPKPSWREAVPIANTQFSGPKDKLLPVLRSSLVVVTHGSNISFEAALYGIPSIVLGEGIGFPISSHRIDDIGRNKIRRPDRQQWFNNVAYWQWTEDEMKSGEAWNFLRRHVESMRVR